MLGSLVRRVAPRRLDPERVARVRREFDGARGYGAYHEACRRLLRRPLPGGADGLAQRGFERLRVLTPERARELLERLRAGQPVSRLKRGTDHLEGFRLEPGESLRELLEAVLGPPVDERALRCFGSEYLVHWATVTRTLPPRRAAADSFLWHCDRGPSAHLKLLVYLNDVSEHGGNTEFADRESTDRLADSGYLFGPVRHRREDLSGLARELGLAWRPWSARLDAGEGLLFEPARVLHRGVRPRTGARYVLTLCLLPSPRPWREALERGVLSDLGRDEKWHADATELLRRLAPEALSPARG